MNHRVKESAVELVQSGVCLVSVRVPVWVNLGVVDLPVGKQKLRTLVSAVCSSGSSPVHGPARRLAVFAFATSLLGWSLLDVSATNLVSPSAFLTTGYHDSAECFKGLFVAVLRPP